ncbi:hypothetical protein TW95_gp0532 [Pandoravirus inopinatum]|uniref:Uncharacterized protein n=1 Tax=Pandoravirus inopinatum TaxID=1605721 RepID=A0A0B5J8Z1_9VIRU|nr:hypothetical protein TW95_gp0532 [Pandoravirus inopinatum]AJF97266.1 hypothetical protein [Pandoravirus inopinatum]
MAGRLQEGDTSMIAQARFRAPRMNGGNPTGAIAYDGNDNKRDDKKVPVDIDPLNMVSLIDPYEPRPLGGDGPFDVPAAGECLRLLEEAFVVALHDDLVAEIVARTADALGAREPTALIGAYARLGAQCDRRASTHPCATQPRCAMCTRAPTVSAVAAALERLDALDGGLGARASIVDARRRAMSRALAQPDDVPAAVDAYRAYLHATYATLYARYVAFWTLVVRQPTLARASACRPHHVGLSRSAPGWGGARMLTPRDLAQALSASGQHALGRLLMAQQRMEPVYTLDPPLTLSPLPGAAPMCRRWAALPEAGIVACAVDIHEDLAMDDA